MAYCAYCGATMGETADVCPICGKWKRQVETPGGKATVREPAESEKTRIYNRGSLRPAEPAASPRAQQPRPQTAPQAVRTEVKANASPARQQLRTNSEVRQPVYRAPAPQPVRRESAPQPVRREPAPQQTYREPAPQPVRQEPDPQPEEKNVTSQVKETVTAVADTVKTQVRATGKDVSGALKRMEIPRSRLYAVAGFLAALVLVVVVSASIASGSGVHGVVKKLAKAYEHQSAEEMMALGGALMNALYPDAELEQECRENIDVVRDDFSDRLGSRYRFSWDITLGKTYKGDELQSRLESTYGDLGGTFDLSQVEAMTSATLTLQARHSGAKAEKRIAVILVKENGKWKLASQLV